MTPSDWLLLAVDLASPKPVQPVQIQKILFLLDRKLPPPKKGTAKIYDFSPYDYGPFDAAVYSDAEWLASEGHLMIQKRPGQNFKQYTTTKTGHERATEIATKLDPHVTEYAAQLVAWCQAQTFNQLVSAVYREYPDMKANSVFKG